MAQLHRIVQAIQQKKEMSLFPMELEKKWNRADIRRRKTEVKLGRNEETAGSKT